MTNPIGNGGTVTASEPEPNPLNAGSGELIAEISSGPPALVPQRLRFGASGLLVDIERILAGGAAAPSPSSY